MGVMEQYLDLPDKHTEYELQHIAHRNLEDEGYTVRGEIPFRNIAGGTDCRFDLLVFKSGELIAIIEMKLDNSPDATEQILRYQAQMGVHVIEIRGLEMATNVVNLLHRALAKPLPKRDKDSLASAKQGVYKKPRYK